MFRISEFSRLTRVSIKALRLYDRLGLLTPAFVDPRTRYRHYAAPQALLLFRILALRELGFPLAEIAGILAHDVRGGSLRRLLERRRIEVRRQIDFEQQRLAQVDAALAELGRRRGDHPEPALRALPAVRIAARRQRVRDLDDGSQALFEAVEKDAARAGIRAAGPPVLIYHDRDHRETDADIEAGVPVVPDARAAGRSTIRTLTPVASAACVVYTGSADQWSRIGRDLAAWMNRRRLAPAGPIREVYLQFDAGSCDDLRLPRAYLAERTEDFVTEMQIPVRRSGSLATAARSRS